MKRFTDKDDRDRYLIKGEVSLDGDALARHNKAVIEETIEKYERDRAIRQKLFAEQLEERSDAVSSFLKAKDKGYEGDSLRYFGKRELARLRGQQIVEKIKTARQSIIKS